MALATVYDSQRDYIKHLKNKAVSESEEDCGCKDAEGKDCGCCPPGLIAIYDDAGHNIGCLSPNDAELYETNLQKCEQGYVKLIRNSDGMTLGCVSEDKFEELYESVNGSLS